MLRAGLIILFFAGRMAESRRHLTLAISRAVLESLPEGSRDSDFNVLALQKLRSSPLF